MFDPEKFGQAMAEMIRDALAPLKSQISELEKRLSERPDHSAEILSQIKQHLDAIELPKPEAPLGIAGTMIDREGSLLFTLSNGDIKNVGRVVGQDGKNGEPGKNGEDGFSFENFEMQYVPESNEVKLVATCRGVTKELRVPVASIQGKGYWRSGVTVKAGDAWSYDGSLWIAVRNTEDVPSASSKDWFMGARRGKDGEPTQRRQAAPTGPIKLEG